MVDAAKPLSGIQNITSKSDSLKSARRSDEPEKTAPAADEDKVTLSEEAKRLAEARDTRVVLENTDFHLGLDPSFDEKI
jgi:hypothetical protein